MSQQQWGTVMGIFFQAQPVSHVITGRLRTALNEQPPANAEALDERAAQLANEVAANTPARTLRPASAIIALLFLGALFAGACYTAYDEHLKDLHDILTHSLQIMLGLLPGAILGEASAPT